ncbi:unnamed protein product [Ranitomeya imitator]|uniref:CW-type domain-containing protein n=1 Tax=Ranitomeya imitator TaxID=111125 RepID=A0ABN9LS88_9NEOB|nr:unnamed protein product [Ranitomeya imitator]
MSTAKGKGKKKSGGGVQSEPSPSPDGLPVRSSGRQARRKASEAIEDEEDYLEKKYRKCEKAGCTATCPVCFASAAERCAKNGYTSRWYHLSCGEHFCNECFDHYYRSHKDGYDKFSTWKRTWTSNGKSEPSPKAFMADQQLPYWVQCTKPECGKWRQLTKEIQLTMQMAKTYRCGMKLNNVLKETSDSMEWALGTLVLNTAEKFPLSHYPSRRGRTGSACASVLGYWKRHPRVLGALHPSGRLCNTARALMVWLQQIEDQLRDKVSRKDILVNISLVQGAAAFLADSLRILQD